MSKMKKTVACIILSYSKKILIQEGRYKSFDIFPGKFVMKICPLLEKLKTSPLGSQIIEL